MPFLAHTRPGHDEELVARLAVDDLVPGSRDEVAARAQVADCPACAELLADVRAVAAATAELPAPARTRDFRLTDADAARLRPAGWRGALARLGSPSFAFTRPLAAGLATLGVAGLLLATIPLGPTTSSSLAPEYNMTTGAGAAAAQDSSGANATAAPAVGPSAAPSQAVVEAPATGGAPGVEPSTAPLPATGGAAPASPGTPTDVRSSAGASAPPGIGVAGGETSKGASPGAAPGGGGAAAVAPTTSPTETAGHEATAPGGPSPLVIVSLFLLVAGVGLGALRIVARRLA